ncbi:uncharacterized protein B0T15DRAFT_555146 [Chaetomium strumarium]|uniref:Uncharacterized protein n=1 Tax=Chaetomium strumarium TaxID=1170767 RepID=A0AAJ0GS89_9PEZI|nr:hypothetical protein B0T15DRAFT_555146 [Chaetomium strumarium]
MSSRGQPNPPGTDVLLITVMSIRQKEEATKANLAHMERQLAEMQRKNKSPSEKNPIKRRIARLRTERDQWPETIADVLTHWLLSLPSDPSGPLPTLPQEVKNQIPASLSNTRIARIEQEAYKKIQEKMKEEAAHNAQRSSHSSRRYA